MGSETPNSDSDWDYPLTDEDLRAIDSAFSSAAATSAHPPKRRHDRDRSGASADSPPQIRRRLPDSLFVRISPCSTRSRFHSSRSNSHLSSFREINFGGRIIYSRTVEEVERAAKELLDFVEAKKRNEEQCILGLDIEWRPTFRRGVPPGKAAVLQICGHNNCCHVMHIIHSGIPEKLQILLEDRTSLKVGVCIANDASKVLQDYNVSVSALAELSDLANQKLGGVPKKWSLSSLTETLICRQLPKPSKIRLGNWEVDVLSKEQLKYAATDAYISWYLYQVLKTYPDSAGNTSAETVST
ncbi:PREDICTED: Werner Syndrome-like exonuclease [Erythranthe guttata]|uniref:Werner Syndrome-like exonuclease n=1 Tax=Erythranthe guttata TaxID=4155 RepID=UPI00064D8D1A|nr:PREDICTED: Werner Syndrome-like exonuclease [Erythranthe guttata]|eukprot:XP_012844548.1 PREDICTED: Werner Syndrome-like exonuclease [Erythranthe guttata]